MLNEFNEEAVSWRRQLAQYRSNLLRIEERKAQFIDPLYVPLNLEDSEQRVREKINELEAKLQGVEQIDVTLHQLKIASQQTGSHLRIQTNKIAGIHLHRPEVNQIIDWVTSADSKQRLAMLLDRPGGGKTVILRAVLEGLQEKGVTTLTIKSDLISGITTPHELAKWLRLPLAIEECAHQLATEGLLVVIIDQLDALSLSLARDQSTLNLMLGTIARLREIPNVRIVASCRTFDLNYDPQLRSIVVDKKFPISSLDKEKIIHVLHHLKVNPPKLSPALWNLLGTPLHLSIFAKIMQERTEDAEFERFSSLQELYNAWWQLVIEPNRPNTPSPSARIAAIDKLVDYMQGRQDPRLTAPHAILRDYPEASTYLKQVDFIRIEGNLLQFSHQTLFDYCYAQRFVASGHSLAHTILQGPQGLFERSQIVQILAYLRGADPVTYEQELRTLISAKQLRVHLLLLLISWLGSQEHPTISELSIAQHFMQESDLQRRFIQATTGSVGWFDLLSKDALPTMLRGSNEDVANAVLSFCGSVMHQRSDMVVSLLTPFIGLSDDWNDRIIMYCLASIEVWDNQKTIDIFYGLLRQRINSHWTTECLRKMYQSNPEAGCKGVSIYLSVRLDELLDTSRTATLDSAKSYAPRQSLEKHLLGEYLIDQIIKAATENHPLAAFQYLFPWFLQATSVLSRPKYRDDYYRTDELFSQSWYGNHISKGPIFAQRMALTLEHLARISPDSFSDIASTLSDSDLLSVHRVLIQAFLSKPARYSDDIFVYLISDQRRLNIGEPTEQPHFDSRRLFVALFPHLGEEQRSILENLILDLNPKWEMRPPHRCHGITQFRFLKEVPRELLSDKAIRRVQELERRFPDFELTSPQGVRGGGVGPPINTHAQEKMSDSAWLKAMRSYNQPRRRKSFFQGGEEELARAFTEQVNSAPERFYFLAKNFSDDIPSIYLKAAIVGLSESDAPSAYVFDLVSLYGESRLEASHRREVIWAVNKRAKDGVPHNILDLLEEWALHDPDPPGITWESTTKENQQRTSWRDPYEQGINSNRGAAVKAFYWCALHNKPVQVERVFTLLQKVSQDRSTAVRSCIMEGLTNLLREDAERVLDIFDQTMANHPALLSSQVTHHFLQRAYQFHFSRVHNYIQQMIDHEDDTIRYQGSVLACLASFRHPEATNLARQALTGDEAMRRGASLVYARNVEFPEIEAICRKHLLTLINDIDQDVLQNVGDCFQYLHPGQLDEWRPFVEEFLKSPALREGAQNLTEFLVPLATIEHELALTTTRQILNTFGDELTDFQTKGPMIEREIVRLPLTVYNHSMDANIKGEAMTLFEQLLLISSGPARQALNDWDRH